MAGPLGILRMISHPPGSHFPVIIALRFSLAQSILTKHRPCHCYKLLGRSLQLLLVPLHLRFILHTHGPGDAPTKNYPQIQVPQRWNTNPATMCITVYNQAGCHVHHRVQSSWIPYASSILSFNRKPGTRGTTGCAYRGRICLGQAHNGARLTSATFSSSSLMRRATLHGPGAAQGEGWGDRQGEDRDQGVRVESVPHLPRGQS